MKIYSNTLWTTKKIVSIKLDRGDLDSGVIGMDTIVDVAIDNLVSNMTEATKVKKRREQIWKRQPNSSPARNQQRMTRKGWPVRTMTNDGKDKKEHQLTAKKQKKSGCQQRRSVKVKRQAATTLKAAEHVGRQWTVRVLGFLGLKKN